MVWGGDGPGIHACNPLCVSCEALPPRAKTDRDSGRRCRRASMEGPTMDCRMVWEIDTDAVDRSGLGRHGMSVGWMMR